MDRVKEEWMGPFLTTFKLGTTKSYCGSACLFVDFLLAKKVVQKCGEAAAAQAQFSRLSKTLRKRSLRRRTEVETEALESLVTPQMVQALLANLRIVALETLLKDPNFTTYDSDVYIKCRDYVMFRVLLENGQRTGVLDGITPSAISKARITPAGAVITVAKHKTNYCGPAQIAFPGTLWRYTLALLHCLKSMPGYKEDSMRQTSIFLAMRSVNEAPVTISVSGINQALKRLWRMAHRDSTISATILRKSVVTAVNKPEMSLHSVSTIW